MFSWAFDAVFAALSLLFKVLAITPGWETGWETGATGTCDADGVWTWHLQSLELLLYLSSVIYLCCSFVTFPFPHIWLFGPGRI